MKTKLARVVAEIQGTPLVVKPSWHARFANFSIGGRFWGDWTLRVQYKGGGRFALLGHQGREIRPKHKELPDAILAALPITPSIEGVINLPWPPFVERVEAGPPDHSYGWFQETHRTPEEVRGDVKETLRCWAASLFAVPLNVGWCQHTWGVSETPCGDYGNTVACRVLEGTTLQDIRDWVESLP